MTVYFWDASKEKETFVMCPLLFDGQGSVVKENISIRHGIFIYLTVRGALHRL